VYLIVRVDAVYVHFFMQKGGEERIFPPPNIYYRTFFFCFLTGRKASSIGRKGLDGTFQTTV